MVYLSTENDTKGLYLFINSHGEWVIPEVSIYDTMQFVQPDVHTICMGLTTTMGSCNILNLFSGYVFWECLEGLKFKPGLGQNGLAGLVDKWSVGVKEVMGLSLWDGKGCIFALNFGNSCAELGF
ncbi:hypothetical protein Gotur_003046 [Gossypium turneri]